MPQLLWDLELLLLPSHDDISEGTVGKEKRAKEINCLLILIWTFVVHREWPCLLLLLFYNRRLCCMCLNKQLFNRKVTQTCLGMAPSLSPLGRSRLREDPDFCTEEAGLAPALNMWAEVGVLQRAMLPPSVMLFQSLAWYCALGLVDTAGILTHHT